MLGTKITLNTDVAFGGGKDGSLGEFFEVRLRELEGLIVGVAIDNNYFEITEGLRGEVGEEMGEIFFFIQRRDHDREEGFLASHIFALVI